MGSPVADLGGVWAPPNIWAKEDEHLLDTEVLKLILLITTNVERRI